MSNEGNANTGTAGNQNANANAGSGNANANAGSGNTGAAFDWKTSGGVDDTGIALVNERQWKNPNDLLTSYRNLEKLTGVPAEQIIKLPKGNDPAEWGQVYDRLGRPKDASGYKLPVPEGDKGEFAKVAAGWFHEAGLSEASATKLAEKWNGHVASTTKAEQEKVTQEHSAQVGQLKTEWGTEYQARTVLVDRAAETFGMTQEQLTVLKHVMGPKAAMKFMHNIGSKIAVEDKNFVNGDGQRGFQGMTPESAVVEIAKLRGDKTFSAMFNSPDLKLRSEAREKMDRLHKIAYPG